MKRKNYDRPSMKVVMLQQSAALMQVSRSSYERGGQQNWDNSSVESSRSDYEGGGQQDWE
ncbi:MAG: hypothetical protein II826_03900 [Prevotella sp.]|nr:hypothetical protein [Prevotella sp.]